MSKNLLKYVILPLVLFLAAIAVSFWILLPIYNDAQAALLVREQNQQNLIERKKLTANLNNLIGQYNEKSADIASFERAIPTGQNMAELLVNLESLASESGITFSGVNFKIKDFKAAGFKTLIMELKLKGSYPALLNYLKAAEKSLRLFDVTALSFSGVGPGQLGAKTDALEFNVVINTYFQ